MIENASRQFFRFGNSAVEYDDPSASFHKGKHDRPSGASGTEHNDLFARNTLSSFAEHILETRGISFAVGVVSDKLFFLIFQNEFHGANLFRKRVHFIQYRGCLV